MGQKAVPFLPKLASCVDFIIVSRTGDISIVGRLHGSTSLDLALRWLSTPHTGGKTKSSAGARELARCGT